MRRVFIAGGLVAVVSVVVLCAGASAVLADGGGSLPTPGPTEVSLINPLCTSGTSCQNSTAAGLIKSIVDWLFVIATPIAVGMIIFGAIQMLTAAGNPDRFAAGRRTVLYAVIGYAIILIGWGITSIIQSVLSA